MDTVAAFEILLRLLEAFSSSAACENPRLSPCRGSSPTPVTPGIAFAHPSRGHPHTGDAINWRLHSGGGRRPRGRAFKIDLGGSAVAVARSKPFGVLSAAEMTPPPSKVLLLRGRWSCALPAATPGYLLAFRCSSRFCHQLQAGVPPVATFGEDGMLQCARTSPLSIPTQSTGGGVGVEFSIFHRKKPDPQTRCHVVVTIVLQNTMQ